MRRRDVLAGTASVLTVGIAGCGSDGTDGEASPTTASATTGQTTATASSIAERYPEATTEIQKEAAAYLEEHFPVDKERATYDKLLRNFLGAKEMDVSEAFVDKQLQVWMSLAEQYDNGREWQHATLAVHGLYQNDWTKNGVPHLEPSGNGWKAVDDPLALDEVPDAIPRRFYDADGRTHDPATGEYLGFQPENGDKAGIKGDRNDNGRIVEIVNGLDNGEFYYGPVPGDLNPESMHTFLWIDGMGGEDGGLPIYPTQETTGLIEDLFEQKIPDQILQDVTGGDHSGIHFHPIQGRIVEWDEKTTREEAQSIYSQSMPDELKGVVNYAIFVDHIDTNINDGRVQGIPLASKVGEGGIVELHSDDEIVASVTVEEVYGHSIGKIAKNKPDDSQTLMSPENPVFDFLDEEWRQLIENMNMENRDVYDTNFKKLQRHQ